MQNTVAHNSKKIHSGVKRQAEDAADVHPDIKLPHVPPVKRQAEDAAAHPDIKLPHVPPVKRQAGRSLFICPGKKYQWKAIATVLYSAIDAR